MRVVLIPTLGVFIGLSAGVSVAAQERVALEGLAPRVRASAASAVSPPMQSAVLGYVANAPTLLRPGHRPMGPTYSSSSAQVRAIVGIPGAAALSGPLVLPRGIERVYLAPGQNYALVEQMPGTLAFLQFTGTRVGLPVAIAGAIEKPDIVTFSPGAASAAIFSADEGHLQVVTGLPASPQLSRDLSGADLPTGIAMLALADDGTLLAGASDGRVLVVRPGGAYQVVYSATELGGIAFAPASDNALVFDRDGAKALLLQNAASAPSVRMLAEGLPGLSGAAILHFDGGTAVVGTMNGKQLSRIDIQTLHVDNLTLNAGLTMLQPLLVSHRFLLSAQPGEPAWLLDTSRETSAVYFVPPQHIAMAVR